MAFVHFTRQLLFKPQNYMFLRFITQINTEDKELLDRKKGLLVGVYTEGSCNIKDFILTPTAKKFNTQTGGKLMEELRKVSHKCIMIDGVHLFQRLDPEFFSVALVNLGKNFSHDLDMDENHKERLDVEELKNRVRVASGIGIRALCKQGITHILMEGLGNAQCAAEAACIAVWRFKQRQPQDKILPNPSFELYADEDETAWQRGLLIARAQICTLQMLDTICSDHNTSKEPSIKKKDGEDINIDREP